MSKSALSVFLFTKYSPLYNYVQSLRVSYLLSEMKVMFDSVALSNPFCLL